MTEESIKEELSWLAANRKFRVVTVDQIISKEYGPEKWTIEKLIPEQSITAIAAAPGSFKTWLTLDIARCVASGEDFLGQFKVTKGSVLFIDKENHFRHIQKRLKQLGVDKSYPIYYLNQDEQDFFVEDKEKFLGLKRMVRSLGISLVVFDSLVRIHSGDENDAKNISAVIGKFKQITSIGASVIFVHHHRKEPAGKKKSGNSLRGSSDILAGVDSLLIVEKIDKESLTIDQAKLRQDQAQEPFGISIQSNDADKTMKFGYAGAYDPDKVAVDQAITSIEVLLKEKGELAKQDLTDFLSEEYSANHVSMALKKASLADIGSINLRKGPSNKHFYSLK